MHKFLVTFYVPFGVQNGCCVIMNPNIKYVVVLPIILVFTCLAVALDINLCGSLFTKSCQRDEVYKQMTALLATALALFIIGTMLAFISIFKSKSWIFISEFITVVAGGTLLLTALCIYYQGKHFWAPLVAGIAMTLGMQTSLFMLLDMVA